MSVNGADPHSKVMDAIRHGEPIEAQYVRQGKRSMRVVWVLAISLALAALATFGMWMMRAPGLARAGVQQSTSGRELHQPLPTVRQTPAEDPTAAHRWQGQPPR